MTMKDFNDLKDNLKTIHQQLDVFRSCFFKEVKLKEKVNIFVKMTLS